MNTLSLKVVTATLILALSISLLYAKSDSELKKKIIQQSIAAYPKNCPCPYNRASNGSICGKRSAYSRSGGYAPICFESDITPEMLKHYK
ncbi:MAG: hypothetical protein K0U47_09200 [Epsilonproteobacteria bacterium]|nr:hypothetical protein [Campylobacterota bacterium]